MSCPKTKLISAYIDQELELGQKTAFEAHVRGCNRCSQALEAFRSLRTAFSNTERFQAPYAFTARIIARAAKPEKKQTPWLVPFFIRFAEAAVLLIVIAVGVLTGKVVTHGSHSPAHTMNIASSLSLDLFEATPPGSLGSAYLAMTEVRSEK